MKDNKDFSQELLDLIEDAKKKGKRYYIIPSKAINRWRENNKKKKILRLTRSIKVDD